MPILSRFLALPALLLALPPLAARADCVDDAAARHGINAGVLRAIGWQESRLQPLAFHRNADGSVDLGAFQINSVHLPELAALGVTRDALDSNTQRNLVQQFLTTEAGAGGNGSVGTPR